MTPGTHLEFDSTLNMMFVYGRVLQFDRNALTVTFDYWGMKETVPLSKVRMRREKKTGRFNFEWWMYLACGMVGGGLLSWLATWLIMR